MCGLAGFIGKSKNPSISYQLITRLFEKSDSRGVDAAGFWGTEEGVLGKVLYHKEPLKSAEFVKKDIWKKNNQFNIDLLFTHARGASKGVGHPTINYNNHPFTSYNKSLGLIHNGRIDEKELNTLRHFYELKGNCDSEILLRIIEAAEYSPSIEFGNFEHPLRLMGIRDVFNLINEGHMAVALGERLDNGERAVWLFRNKHRPLWIIDTRETLGQIFFVSDPLIWKSAVKDCALDKFVSKTQKLVEMPTEEIWYTKTTPENPTPEIIQKFGVKKQKSFFAILNLQKHKIIQKNRNFEIVTGLDDNDFINNVPLTNKVNSSVDIHRKFNKLIQTINEIREKVNEIPEESYPKLLNSLDLETEVFQKLKNETLI